MKSTTFCIVSAGLLSMASTSVSAYTTYACDSGNSTWASKEKTLYAYTGSFPANSRWRVALEQAVKRLNDNAAGFRFTISYTSTAPSMGNGRSEVWFEDISAPGVTNYSWNPSTCNLVEADVRMDSSVFWTTSSQKGKNLSYGGNARPLQTTLLHELGHAMGLGHEADEYNIMGADWNHIHTNGESSRAYFGEDASDGSVYLYGSTARQDLGVVHWRRTGASGEYSTHSKTRLLDPDSGNELNYSDIDGEKRYNVSPGQSVRMELTYENNGNSYQYEDVSYYVSADSTITTLDTVIASRSLEFTPDDAETSTYDVTVPADLSCNTPYWLGAIVDADNSLPERLQWNNATYLPIYIDTCSE